MANEISAIEGLVRQNMALTRLLGLTLAVMKERKLLTADQVVALIEDSRQPLRPDDVFQQVLSLLQDELQ